jgi:asparagine synthase (glutamine-hydrolysing)
MSGIAGIIHFDGAPVEPGLVEQMTTAMAYRGPDGINHWVKGPVALGQCMLRTTPESLEENQPLTNDDASLVLVMDGRVDNWEELRVELLGRGAVLRTRSDAELVLRAYENWGRECLKHIDGDFALVIWDARKQKAFCARDRMGNKPFHYHWNGKTLAFASDLRPILTLPWVERIPNEGMLAEFLADEWYSRDETLWSGILRLVAAHRMEVGTIGPKPEQYWEPDIWETLPYKTDQDYIEHYRELLFDRVRRLSRSHRPVAYEVSGGLDSSAVFCVAEGLRRAGRLPAPGIEGYTMAFTDDSEANEIKYARAVGEYLGVRIQEIPSFLPPPPTYTEFAHKFEDFPGYPNGVMHLNLYRHIRPDGGVALLTGLGGDQWLTGSQYYYAEELVQRRWPMLRDCFAADMRTLGIGQTMGWFFRYGLYAILPETLRKSLQPLRDLIIKEGRPETYWLSPHLRNLLDQRRQHSQRQPAPSLRHSGQHYLLETLYYPFGSLGTELTERFGAQAGIEIRHPFQSAAFAQYAFSTPERLRLRGNIDKYIHIRALQGILPQIILDRKSKADFSIVFSTPLEQMKAMLIETLPRERNEWLSQNGIAQLFRSYEENPELGLQNWALWNIYGCDRVFHQQEGKQTG